MRKTFVLVPLLLLTPALVAQAWPSSCDTIRNDSPGGSAFSREESRSSPRMRESVGSDVDFKLMIIRPRRDIDARIIVGRPDPRYEYKALRPRSRGNERPDRDREERPRRAPRRKR